jgi:hypothetical protein
MQAENNQEKFLCPCCGAKLSGRWENVSKGLVKNLIRFREQVLEKRENKIHLLKDLNLTHSQYNNFQKLRFHGLIAHYKNPITKKEESGYWLLTKRGNLFCKNQTAIPKKVLIFRNRIQERGEEKITASYILKSTTEEPYWSKKDDYEYQIAFQDINDFDNNNDNDSDSNDDSDYNGQGTLF